MSVTVRPVEPWEQDDYFAMMGPYHRDLDVYDPHASESHGSDEAYRAAVLADMEGRELLWIESHGIRAGFAMVRVFPDWPDESRDVATISEFYVSPAFRRHGVGRGAVEAILADHRERGTFEVEAGILRDNAAAIAFWARMGFELRFYQTARRP
ncbi:MAG: GNAT family N-acetyltransferase [Dehalococcoidia bacterium]|nr:GNAT family N-acetyltransferase [Dehalococcoidia bacterium]